MIEPKIDDLLAQVDSKYTLVTLSAKRAREINSYYNQLGEGRAEFVPPLVETGLRNKPLSIALEEIAEGKVTFERPEGITGSPPTRRASWCGSSACGAPRCGW